MAKVGRGGQASRREEIWGLAGHKAERTGKEMKGVQGFFQRWELGVSGSGPIFPTVTFFFF